MSEGRSGPQGRTLLLLVGLVSLALFLLVAASLTRHQFDSQELESLRRLHRQECRELDGIAWSFAHISGRWEVALAILAWIWMWRNGRRLLARNWFLVHLGGGVLTRGLKPVFQVERPHEFAYKAVFHDYYSFPSGHVLMSVCGYGYLAFLVYRGASGHPFRYLLATGLALIPIAVMWSRVYQGVHTPRDVIAAGLLGLSWLCLFLYAQLTWESRCRAS